MSQCEALWSVGNGWHFTQHMFCPSCLLLTFIKLLIRTQISVGLGHFGFGGCFVNQPFLIKMNADVVPYGQCYHHTSVHLFFIFIFIFFWRSLVWLHAHGAAAVHVEDIRSPGTMFYCSQHVTPDLCQNRTQRGNSHKHDENMQTPQRNQSFSHLYMPFFLPLFVKSSL